MKYLIILGDGMADWPVKEFGGKTILQNARKPYMDMLARKGRTGTSIVAQLLSTGLSSMARSRRVLQPSSWIRTSIQVV